MEREGERIKRVKKEEMERDEDGLKEKLLLEEARKRRSRRVIRDGIKRIKQLYKVENRDRE